MVIDDSHVLFNESDFTPDEIERRNVIAVAIIEKQRKVCKICGREGQELAEPCRAPCRGLLSVTVKGAQQRVQNRELAAAAELERDLREARKVPSVGTIVGRMQAELLRQSKLAKPDAPYVDLEMGIIDGGVDLEALARAALGVSDK